MNSDTPELSAKVQRWQELARALRVDSIRATTAAGSGHPTSSLSAAELMAVLLASYLRVDLNTPRAPYNDRLLFSKGHAAPLLYALLKAAGALTDAELLSLRQAGSPVQGHPAPALPFVEVATGSLGQGLAAAVGMALGARLAGLDNRFWVLLGDSEMAEGSVYESLDAASVNGLERIVAVLDMNRLGQRGPTAHGWHGEVYAERARAFGWDVHVIDGHDVSAIDAAYAAALTAQRPTFIVAKTKKGAGVSFIEDREGWHGKPLSQAESERALAELGFRPEQQLPAVTPARPEPREPKLEPARPVELPSYAEGKSIATRAAFGDALAAVGADPRVVALDAEVANSTYTERFGAAHRSRFFELYIAEQQLVSAAVGLHVLGFKPFAATFAAFFSRAYDQIRMASISEATLNLAGSHAGVSIGEDGPSQMALEDLAMLRAVHGSTVLYPACGNATVKLVAAMAAGTGVQYLRTTREKTPILYPPSEAFPIGGSKTLRSSERDQVAVIAGGITVHEALKAHAELERRGIAVRVIDLYSVKPVDRATLERAAAECSAGFVVVEDHHPEGGLADAVAEVFAERGAPPLQRLAVRSMPGSAKPEEQLVFAGIDASSIVTAVTALTRSA